MSNSYAANITGGEANSTLNSQEKISKGTRAGAIIFPSSDIYKVTVTFDSITVNDNHEGLFSGDGEYNLAAYVQGIKVGLTDASEPANCAGLGCTGGPALLDVSSGETVFFKPGTEVSIDLPGTVSLSIFTTGFEVDSCGLIKLPEGDSFTLDPQFPGLTLVDVFKNPQLDWSSAVIAFLNYVLYHETCGGYDDNDILGIIYKFYNPPGHSYEPIGWGAGSHTNVVSSTGDYTLRYTITVIPKIPEKQIESSNLSNKFKLNNTFTLNKQN
jgi:hypothetical protein